MTCKTLKKPLVIVFGTTGTGKSDLGVALATEFNGEVINADAMQLYKGLPIVTNQMSAAEQQGVQHHLLGQIDIHEDPWQVSKFKAEATKLINDIHQRGRLPIVVGGTHYYIDSLLFDDRTIERENTGEAGQQWVSPGDQNTTAAHNHAILDGPPELILQKLREVDPVMADRWHPKDARKIRRSLEIYLNTGRRASEVYAEQQRRREERLKEKGWPALLFWVYTDMVTLDERLRRRVDKMVGQGLLDEAQAHLDQVQQLSTTDSTIISKTTGVRQAIGLSHLEPYLQSKCKSQHLLDQCLESMKISTRQCAVHQLRWIKRKTVASLQQNNLLDSLYLVDSGNAARWQQDVIQPAMLVTHKYLEGEAMPVPSSLSETAQKVLADAAARKKQVPCRKVCDVCNSIFVLEQEWDKHLTSRAHRRAVSGARRKALILVEPETPAPEQNLSDEESRSTTTPII